MDSSRTSESGLGISLIKKTLREPQRTLQVPQSTE
jgi:hypothetical protein